MDDVLGDSELADAMRVGDMLSEGEGGVAMVLLLVLVLVGVGECTDIA